MTQSVSLFAARAAIVDLRTGRMTPEFFKALQALVRRLGGEASDAEIDLTENSAYQVILGLLATYAATPEKPHEPKTYTTDLERRVQLLEGIVSELIAR